MLNEKHFFYFQGSKLSYILFNGPLFLQTSIKHFKKKHSKGGAIKKLSKLSKNLVILPMLDLECLPHLSYLLN